MNRALVYLIWLRAKGGVRRWFLPGTRPRQIVGGIVAALIFVGWVTSAIAGALVPSRGSRFSPEGYELVIAPLLALTCLLWITLSFRSSAIALSPAEAEFILPGPFTRMEVIVYRLLWGMGGVLFFTLLVGVRAVRTSGTGVGAFLGTFLAGVLVQMVGVLSALLRQRFGAATVAALGAAILSALGFGVYLAARHAIEIGGSEGVREFFASLRRTRESLPASIALAPFSPFAQVFNARTVPGALAWAVPCLAFIAIVFGAIVRLDRYATGAILEANRRREALLLKRRGQVAENATSGFTLPAPAWLGGAGPVAWRQAATALRSLATGAVFVGVGAVVLYFLLRRTVTVETLPLPICIIAAGAATLSALAMAFDFRSDLDRMDVLKSLPVSPLAVAAGQVIVPTLLVTGAHAVLAGVIVVAFLHSEAWASIRDRVLACWGIAAFPGSFLACAVLNSVFLLMPVRARNPDAADMNHVLRQSAQTVVNGFALSVCGFVVALVVIGARALGASAVACAASGAAAMLILGLGALGVLTRLFRNFDPSRDA